MKKVWASLRSGRNFENHRNLDFHGLGHVESPSRPKNRRFRCAAHNVLKDLACRDGVVQVILSRDPLVLDKSAGQSESTIYKFWVGFWAPATEIPKKSAEDLSAAS